MGFSRQEYWSGLPFPSPGDLPNPGVEPLVSCSAGGFFTPEPPGKPLLTAIEPYLSLLIEHFDSSIKLKVNCFICFPSYSVVKNLPVNAGDPRDAGLIPVGKIPWQRACQPTPVFLPGESHGQKNLVDYSP